MNTLNNIAAESYKETLHALTAHLSNLRRRIIQLALPGDLLQAYSNESIYRRISWRLRSGDIDKDTSLLLLEIMLREFDHFHTLVDNFLGSLSRDSGAESLEKKAFDLALLVEDVADLFDPWAEEKGIELRVLLPDEEAVVKADRQKIRRALVNILSNALKYSDETSPRGQQRYISIFLRRHTVGGSWLLSVSSFGKIGLDREEARKVFEYGFRGHMAEVSGIHGTGIGLAETRRIVDAHNGWVQLTSNKQGEGVFRTDVSIFIP